MDIDNFFEEFCFKENQRNWAIAGSRSVNKSFPYNVYYSQIHHKLMTYRKMEELQKDFIEYVRKNGI